ncbi:MAG TPA: response regulator [Candidatus Acidoferrales bacterium]|jgi:DNA-binding response OmpR family regulator|nr:response regulator [Candidatus Acidoferrales bacterium]
MNENNFLQPETIPQPRILVAEDSPDIRRLNTEALTAAGYIVDAAEDGAAAWGLVQLHEYDLLVTDNEMPKVSGLGLLQLLHDARVPLPVIMVTGTSPQEQLERQPWLQIEVLLLKPYTFDELLNAVKNVLRAHSHGQTEIAPPNRRHPPVTDGRRLE